MKEPLAVNPALRHRKRTGCEIRTPVHWSYCTAPSSAWTLCCPRQDQVMVLSDDQESGLRHYLSRYKSHHPCFFIWYYTETLELLVTAVLSTPIISTTLDSSKTTHLSPVLTNAFCSQAWPFDWDILQCLTPLILTLYPSQRSIETWWRSSVKSGPFNYHPIGPRTWPATSFQVSYLLWAVGHSPTVPGWQLGLLSQPVQAHSVSDIHNICSAFTTALSSFTRMPPGILFLRWMPWM